MIKVPVFKRIMYSTANGVLHKPVVVGQDDVWGRRQFVPGAGADFYFLAPYFGEKDLHGMDVGYMCDSQRYNPDGTCSISARYGVRLDDGRELYFENNGKRAVPPEMAPIVMAGGLTDPKYQYHVCVCNIEAFDPSLKWLEKKMVIQTASRVAGGGRLDFWLIDLDVFEDDGVTRIEVDKDIY